MMEDDRADQIEEEYDMPPGRVMYHLYHEKGMSQYEIAEEIGVPRETARYWLQRSGIKMRSRTLTDAQKLLIIAYLSAGLGLDRTATKVDCGRATVQRYRKELSASERPVDIDTDLSTREWDILCEIIRDDIAARVTTSSAAGEHDSEQGSDEANANGESAVAGSREPAESDCD